MEEKKYLDLLAKRDIQPTAIRILVLRTMMQAGRSVSLLDLETMLDTVDKSTIFRTLTLFLEHDVVHAFEDGRGVICYELCAAHGSEFATGCQCVLQRVQRQLLLRRKRPAHPFPLREMQQNLLLHQHSHSGGEAASRIYTEQHQLCTERHLSGLCSRSQPGGLVKK